MPRKKIAGAAPGYTPTCVDCGKPSILLQCDACSSPFSAAGRPQPTGEGRMPNDRRRNGSMNLTRLVRGE